ncbi:MAG: hypothetical protein FWG30_01125 [Eubacteriaceae bacterium]|nr:hypothetical protein [Eubacteriaceae bacterium]
MQQHTPESTQLQALMLCYTISDMLSEYADSLGTSEAEAACAIITRFILIKRGIAQV